jgi:nucleotide-binding universal stress UspA family protein
MSIFNRILFAGDLSEHSRAAFGAACSLARGPDAHLSVVHVVEPVLVSEPTGRPRGARFPTILPGDTPGHRKEVEDHLRLFYHADVPTAADYLVRDGHPTSEILRAADEVDPDLIVVGTHSRRGVDRLICGSVAEDIMRRSSRPVLIVRTEESSLRGAPIRVILHPTDFSAGSWPALGVARALARTHRARLVLLHVAPAEVLTGGTFYAPADLRPEREALEQLKDESAKAGLGGSVQAVFRRGDAVSEILLSAEDLGCDLIVMGSHGRTGLRRLLMGSVAEVVIRNAPCLTLIIKDVPDEEAAVEAKEKPAVRDAGAIA